MTGRKDFLILRGWHHSSVVKDLPSWCDIPSSTPRPTKGVGLTDGLVGTVPGCLAQAQKNSVGSADPVQKHWECNPSMGRVGRQENPWSSSADTLENG